HWQRMLVDGLPVKQAFLGLSSSGNSKEDDSVWGRHCQRLLLPSLESKWRGDNPSS
ncbi:unnamed protein product, partial [Allacma fusca]